MVLRPNALVGYLFKIKDWAAMESLEDILSAFINSSKAENAKIIQNFWSYITSLNNKTLVVYQALFNISS